MSTRSIVLRALLGLCLVLNGSGTAVAAVQMTTAMGVSHTMASDTVTADTGASVETPGADCHGQDMAADATHGSAMEHDGARTSHPSPDCCKHGVCQCACAQHAQATIALFTAEGSIGVAGIALHALADGRLAPVPDALLRPPIA